MPKSRLPKTVDMTEGPRIVRIGKSLSLYETTFLTMRLGVPVNKASAFLEDLDIPILKIGNRTYFSILALESALDPLAERGGPGLDGK